ncbi:MAG: lipopolysaccharide biosynthesis protein [Bacteroidaceae bacterium]|mgnify:FL=1|nr:lipopolysaccharide biosynthesis protein [Bacteroidaceae bacterium]
MGKLQSLAKDTAIYGLSSIIGRFLNYLLVPLYTAKMSVESGNYGVVTNIYAWTAILLVFLTFGFETTFFRFASKEKGEVNKVFSMSMQVIGALCGVFLLLVFLFLPSVADALGYSMHPEFIGMMAVVVALDALQSIPFGLLRLQNRALKFASLKLLNIFTNITLNLVVFVLLPWLNEINPGVFNSFYNPDNQAFYVFFINLVCTSFITFFFIPELKIFRFTFDGALLKSMLKYSWPLLLLGIAGILNLNADKILYPYLVPGEEGIRDLSIYGASVKVAAIMAMLMQAFRYAYEPFVFGNSKEKDSKALYAKAMKYFIVIALLAFLVVMFYMDILRHIISPGYWSGLKVVPIIMAAEIFMGIYFNLSFWYKLNDETYWGAIFSFVGCALLFVINILFVPKYGYMACAWASFTGYFTAMLLSYVVGQKRNAINYDIKDIFKYVALFGAVYGISLVLPIENTVLKMACNTILLIIFVAYFIKKDLPLNSIPVIKRFFK